MAITLKGSSAELMGLSTDTKPDNVDINTVFNELDTGDSYFNDGSDWVKMSNGSGGVGGGSDIVYVPIVVDYTDPDNLVVTCSTNIDTIVGYINAGKMVYLKEQDPDVEYDSYHLYALVSADFSDPFGVTWSNTFNDSNPCVTCVGYYDNAWWASQTYLVADSN